MAWIHWLTVSALLVLAGCSTGTGRYEDQTWLQRNAALQELTSWKFDGRVALRTSEQSQSANIQWQQREQQSQLRMSGPLGSGSTRIDSDGQRVEFRQGDQHSTWDLDSAEVTSQDWYLPLRSLPHWLKGIPAPDTRIDYFKLVAGQPLLEKLVQDGWEVSYRDYKLFGSFLLPTRVDINREGSRARLAIHRWQALP